MRALVAGASGFIGRQLVTRLKNDGNDVRALARLTSDTSALKEQGIEVRAGSLTDKDFLANVCRGVDVVYNLIGQIGGWGVRVEDLRLSNVIAVKNLLEACQGSCVSRFVHCSTPGVVGMSGVASESLPYGPAAPYEQTKYEGEKIALGFHLTGDTPVTIARPDFVYGPGDFHKLKLFRAIRNGKFFLIGDGSSLLHPTYVDDVVDGLILMTNNEACLGEVFNLAGPEPVTVSHLASAIADRLDVTIPRLRAPVTLAKAMAIGSEAFGKLTRTEPRLTRYQVNFFSRDHASDIGKAKSVLGYRPRISLEEGVGRTVGWYREQGLI